MAFAYAAREYRYVVSTEATIELSADSGSRAESRATTAHVTYRVAPGRAAGPRTVTGAVDSFTVALPGAGAPTPGIIAAPVGFRGTINPTRRHVELRPTAAVPVAADCGSPTQAVLAVAREAIVVPPPTLTVGQRWTDSTVSTICRGDVPLTTRAAHEYEVVGVEEYAGVHAFHVTRSATLELSGQGAQRGVSFAVTGRGSSRADLYLDAAAGRFLGGSGESTVELDVAVPGRGPQRFRQRGRTRIELK